MTYKVIVDNGKPYEQIFNTELEIISFLDKLGIEYKEDYAYCNVLVFDNDNNDITDYIFNKLEEIGFKEVKR